MALWAQTERSSRGDEHHLCGSEFARFLEYCLLEGNSYLLEQLLLATGSEESIMANLDESFGQDMAGKSCDKFVYRQGHDLLYVASSAVSIAEVDLSLGQSDEPIVADGNFVGIPAQVFEYG